MSDKIVRRLGKTPVVGIYMVTNTVNQKIYIGQSIDIDRRWNQHRYGKGSIILRNAINKYGINNFKFEVVEAVDSRELSKNEITELLVELEQKWLDCEKPYLKENGYNQQSEAKPNIPIKRPEGYGELISKIKIDNNHCGKTVFQFDLNGELIKEWKSAAQIERVLGYHAENISSCCLKKQKSSNGYIWIFSTEQLSGEQLSKAVVRENPVHRQVNQISLNGEIVDTWYSLKKLVDESEFDNRPVKACCNGTRNEYKGYKWEWAT